MSLVHAAPPIPSASFLNHRDHPSSSQLSTPTSSFSSSSSSDDEALTPASMSPRVRAQCPPSLTGTPRKIRFAPLPDPRRDEPELDDDDMLLHPLSRSTSIEHFPTPQLSVHPASPVSANTPAASPATNLLNFPSPAEQHHEPKRRWSSLLKPFSRRSSLSSPSSPSSTFNISTESLLTLGTINLFRTSSRESRRSVNSTVSDCSPLARYSSTASSSSTKKEPGEPLSRSQSLVGSQSLGAPNRHTPRPGTGTRLLNGRVYGRKRPATAPENKRNPFANARDDEPSFVEWGYGGMGSVKNTSGDNRWNKLQASGTGLTGHQEEDDDGSGAAWVRKRKEARERAAREKAETEAKLAAAAAQNNEEAEAEDKVERTETISGSSTTGTTDGTSKPPVAETTATSSTTPSQVSKEHVTSAVTVPAPAPVQRHHSTKSHSSSVDHAVNIVEPKPALQKPSSTSSEDEDGDDAEQDDDDSEEEEFEDAKRRTALGAGVEKISRHNN